LRDLIGRDVIAESANGRYRLLPGLRVAVRHRIASNGAVPSALGIEADDSGAPDSGIRPRAPCAVAAWHAALARSAEA
jgi:hypothetical protein